MRIFVIHTVLLLLIQAPNLSVGQSDTTIYMLPGQGSDSRIFDSLEIDKGFSIQIIEYGTPPERKTSMKEFAQQLSSAVDTTQPFILVGVSLGGMLAVEMTQFLSPVETIIISSAKCRKDLPFRYKFQRVIPMYEIFPPGVLKWGAKRLQPIVEPDRNKNKETFKAMLDAKEPKYMKRTIRMICRWSRETVPNNITHIHGTNDHTLPYRKIKNPDHSVEDGSHMMTLTRAKDISILINECLHQKY